MATPLPIPNREVKRVSIEDTSPARVLENRSSPGIFCGLKDRKKVMNEVANIFMVKKGKGGGLGIRDVGYGRHVLRARTELRRTSCPPPPEKLICLLSSPLQDPAPVIAVLTTPAVPLSAICFSTVSVFS